MSSADLLQAQLLLAAAHRILAQARELRRDLADGHHESAIAELITIRQELRGVDRLLEEIDTAIGVLAYRECLTCDGEAITGRLQCAACAAESAALTPAVESALRTRTTPTWPPEAEET